MRKILISFLILAISASNFAQPKEKRIALVIGNSAYKAGRSLKNPVNDANLMTKTLKALDFHVTQSTDATYSQMQNAIKDFCMNLQDYNVALFYYAGHGVQVDGINYLIPVDADIANKKAVRFETVSVNYVVDEFEYYPDNVNIVILDACRDNPFRSWARGNSQGFKEVNPASGTIIAFATSTGSTAADGDGENGLYTDQLAKQMKISQRIEDVFINTRIEVEKISKGQQSPQEWSKIRGQFYFKKSTEIKTAKYNDIKISEDILPPGIIKLSTEISGNLIIDGNRTGKLISGRAYTLSDIPPGIHTIKIGSWEQTIKVESNKTYYVKAETINENKINKNKGTIIFTTEIPGTLTLDGISKVELKEGMQYTLSGITPGNHTLKLDDWKQIITVDANKTTNIVARGKGRIKLTTEVSDTLFIDNINKGEIKSGKLYTFTNIYTGKHMLRVGDWKQEVQVEYGKTCSVIAKNSKKPKPEGTIILTTEISGVLFIDDISIANLKSGMEYTFPISLGIHTFKLGEWEQTIKIRANKTTAITAKGKGKIKLISDISDTLIY